MFHNVGRKISGFAKFLFYLNLVLLTLGTVIGIIGLCISGADVSEILIAIVSSILGFFLFMLIFYFVSVLPLCGLGILVQNAEETMQARKMAQAATMQTPPAPAPYAPIAPAPAAYAPVPIAPAPAPMEQVPVAPAQPFEQ